MKQSTIPILFRTSAVLATAAIAAIATGCNNQFEKADANKNGQLETTELNAPLAKAIHKAGDANKDGNLTYAEWLKVYPKSNRATFDKYDTYGANGLSLAETTAGLESEGIFKKLGDKIDTSGDGVIDKTEAATFHDAMEAADGENKVQQLDNLINS